MFRPKSVLAIPPGHWYYSPGKGTSIMKNIPFYIITAALVALAPLARAEHKTPTVALYGQSLKAKTEKPDIFGRTKTTYKSNTYKTLGTSVADKPDIFGRTKTTYKSNSYKTLGTTVTHKPDIFGRIKTEIKDKYGRVLGTAVTEKPDIFGRIKTTYKDKYGRTVGSATTEKPDIFGNRKTTHKGHNPFNFFQKKEKKD
ncbi:MAG: hypothetical protein QGI37_09410 [Verrucomicrobiota bacterium]|nr:hypothetical protein [Verrucomicrobiota bacterium]